MPSIYNKCIILFKPADFSSLENYFAHYYVYYEMTTVQNDILELMNFNLTTIHR